MRQQPKWQTMVRITARTCNPCRALQQRLGCNQTPLKYAVTTAVEQLSIREVCNAKLLRVLHRHYFAKEAVT